MEQNRSLRILYLLFFMSGIAALMYQVIWQRLLTYFTGSDITSISLIVSAYMAGLGLGSLAGGYMADHVNPTKRLLLFGMAEALIGIFALCSKFLFYDYLYGIATHAHYNAFIVFVILFGVLLIPTFLMGASLPLLSKTYASSIEHGVSVIGKLYFVNTIGAALGALIPVVLVSYTGFVYAVVCASVLNFICFLTSIYLIYTAEKCSDTDSSVTTSFQVQALSSSLLFWIIVCCITGFLAVSYEIVWFRMISVITKPLYITFSIQLSVFIGGLAIGSLFNRFIPQSSREKSILFFIVQSLIVLYIILSISFFFYAVNNVSFFEPIHRYLGSYEPDTLISRLFILYGGILPYFIFVPTVLMGFSFILLQSILQDSIATMGRKLGLAQFMNIVGSGLGAIITSYVFINYWGTATTFKILITLSVLLVIAAFFVMKRKWEVTANKFVLPVLSIVLLYTVFPSKDIFWNTLHGVGPRQLIVKEDVSGLAAIQVDDGGGEHIMFCNGLGQSKMNYSVRDHHVMFGLLPVLLHPNPQHVAIIGLGSGSTLFGISGRPETQVITCFEIVNPQKEVLDAYNKRFSNVGLTSILSDGRISFVSRDARYSLSTSDQKYDIIEADALRKNSAYSGNLYSKEYFELLKARLKPGGYAVTWIPSERTVRTIRSVFKYCHTYGIILIASDSPIAQPNDMLSKVDNEFSKKFYGVTDIDPIAVLKQAKKELYIIDSPVDSKDINTDLYPKDEFEGFDW